MGNSILLLGMAVFFGAYAWIALLLGLMTAGAALYGTLIAVGAVRPPGRRSFP